MRDIPFGELRRDPASFDEKRICTTVALVLGFEVMVAREVSDVDGRSTICFEYGQIAEQDFERQGFHLLRDAYKNGFQSQNRRGEDVYFVTITAAVEHTSADSGFGHLAAHPTQLTIQSVEAVYPSAAAALARRPSIRERASDFQTSESALAILCGRRPCRRGIDAQNHCLAESGSAAARLAQEPALLTSQTSSITGQCP